MKNTKNKNQKGANPTSKKKRRNRNKTQKVSDEVFGNQRKNRRDIPVLTNRADTSSAFNPNTLWELKRASSEGGMRVKGRELLCQSNSDATGNYTPCTFTTFPPSSSYRGPPNGVAIHPIWFPRLSRLTQLYTFYKFHSLKLTFTTTVPFTNIGSFAYYIESEPNLSAATSISSAMSQMVSVMGPAYSDMVLHLPQDLTSRNGNGRYLCRYPLDSQWNDPGSLLDGATIMQTVQAVLYGGSFSLSIPGSNSIFHTVMAEYDVEFFVPQLNVGNSGTLVESHGGDSEKKEKERWSQDRRDVLEQSKCSCLKTG